MRHVDLLQLIKIDRSVARSVNLDRDADDMALLNRFQITPVGCSILYRLADAIEGESVNAWSLTGPYGTGKSAFCNFLLALTCADQKRRNLCYKNLSSVDKKLATRFKRFLELGSENAPAIGIRAVSRYESLNSTLVRGLLSAIQAVSPRSKRADWEQLRKNVKLLSDKDWPTTRSVVDAFNTLAQVAERPVFVVVDEFGKNLEFQAHHAEKGDIFILQALAESKSIFLWVCLHQAFSSYSGALNRVQREEWQKIQGRFEDRSYIEPPARSFALIRDALRITTMQMAHKKTLTDWGQAMVNAMSGFHLDGMPELDKESIQSFFPFHPLAVYLIGELTRRFAQNDRTIFSFLTSGEAHAFADCLKRLELEERDALPVIGLDMLYDYFNETGMIRHADRSENQRWLEIHAMIAAQGHLDTYEIKLLKTIGVLNLLSTLPGIAATEKMIHAALVTAHSGRKHKTKDLLRDLVEKRVLLYREYAHEYRLWEGSDFDLDREILLERGKVSLRPIGELLEEIAPRPNLVAARHSIQTGTFRDFAVRWCTEDDIPAIKKMPHLEGETDGTLWLMLGKQKKHESLLEIAAEGHPVIVGYAPCLSQVKQLMIEAAATRAACGAPQLERDGVARREALHRAGQAAQALITFLDKAFAPDMGLVSWYAAGQEREIQRHRELSSLVSDLCDHIYEECPRINNEMINVTRISSMAAAARNRVGEALANQSACEDIGLTGYGPEVALYRTVIKETGLHRKNSEGAWVLVKPDKKNQPQLAAIWDLFDRMLEETDRTGQKLPVRQMLDVLKRPPFGLREGPAPLLLSHYLLVHSDEVAVYEENVFKPFLGDAEITLLMRRPELFSLRCYKPSGIRSEVIRTYYQVINTDLKLALHVRNQTLLSVVVPLTEFIKSLPEYTRATRTLSANALRLRNAIINAKDPQQLLFQDIPVALGYPPVEYHIDDQTQIPDAANLRKTLWNALTELRDAFDAFVKKILGRFILAMAETTSRTLTLTELRHDLKNQAEPVLKICLDSDLKPFLAALIKEKECDDDWLFQVAAIVMKKPVQSWQDADLEPFIVHLQELRERILLLRKLKRQSDRRNRDDHSSRFVGISREDGSVVWKNIDTRTKHTEKTRDTLKHIQSWDKETRTNLLLGLLETMEAKGDFK